MSPWDGTTVCLLAPPRGFVAGGSDRKSLMVALRTLLDLVPILSCSCPVGGISATMPESAGMLACNSSAAQAAPLALIISITAASWGSWEVPGWESSTSVVCENIGGEPWLLILP